MTHTEVYEVLQEGKPISIIRAGDGEAIVLNALNGLSEFRTCINSVMKRQMGYEPTMGHVEEIRNNLISAYQGADIVGIPMHENLNELNKHWRGVAETIKPFTTTENRCSTDVFYDMLYDGSLNALIKDRNVVNYISCRQVDFKKLGVHHVNNYLIAPENKFTTYEGEHHYPEQFNKVERWMSKCNIEGKLCLVGAGVIGKIYCNWFRDRGGIAIDVGAVFDLWAGKATRGPLRGLDAVNDKYKL